MKFKIFPFDKQPNSKDCCPTCLSIISKYYGKSISLQQIRNLQKRQGEECSLLGVSDAAEDLGFCSLGVQIDFNTLDEEARSIVLYLRTKNHFSVVYKINKNNVVYISDPSYDLITYTQEEFIKDGLAKKPTKIPKKALL